MEGKLSIRTPFLLIVLTLVGCAPQGHGQKPGTDQEVLLPEKPGEASGSAADHSPVDDGVTPADESPTVLEDAEVSPSSEPPTCRYPGNPTAPWWADAVGYEIFVRSFADSNEDGAGDLIGLREKAAYLEELGVDLVWLMPILESPSYHGYDVKDYWSIDSEYGTEQDVKDLISSFGAKKIRLIMDFVLNHASDQHPWFIQSAQTTQPEYRERFMWSDQNPGWT